MTVDYFMGHANVPQFAVQLMCPKGDEVESVHRNGKVPRQIGSALSVIL